MKCFSASQNASFQGQKLEEVKQTLIMQCVCVCIKDISAYFRGSGNWLEVTEIH